MPWNGPERRNAKHPHGRRAGDGAVWQQKPPPASSLSQDTVLLGKIARDIGRLVDCPNLTNILPTLQTIASSLRRVEKALEPPRCARCGHGHLAHIHQGSGACEQFLS